MAIGRLQQTCTKVMVSAGIGMGAWVWKSKATHTPFSNAVVAQRLALWDRRNDTLRAHALRW